jgi:hypothetical protein
MTALRLKADTWKITALNPTVYKLCTTTWHLLAFTGVYWHFANGQTPQATDLIYFKN